MSKELIKDLELIIEKKYELFYELYEITLNQREDIQNNQGDHIEVLIENKQKVIDRIDQLDESFLKGYEILRKELQLDALKNIDDRRYPELKNIKFSVEKIMELARQTMELEKANKEQLEEIFQKVKSELKHVNVGKRSLKAYAPTYINNDGIYIDKKVR